MKRCSASDVPYSKDWGAKLTEEELSRKEKQLIERNQRISQGRESGKPKREKGKKE